MTDLAQPGLSSLFTRIDHVGVAVADLDEAMEFYQRAYGMTVARE